MNGRTAAGCAVIHFQQRFTGYNQFATFVPAVGAHFTQSEALSMNGI